AIEQASTFGWERYVGGSGRVIGMHTFGASAPLKALQQKFGFEPDGVATQAKELMGKGRSSGRTQDALDRAGGGNMDIDPIALVSTLVEAGSIDTVYRDLYLGRAQTLLSSVVSLEDFHRIEQEQAALAELPLAVARAMERGDWPLVRELSLRADAVK